MRFLAISIFFLIFILTGCRTKVINICPKCPEPIIYPICNELVSAKVFELRNNQICIKNKKTCYKDKNHIIALLRQCVINYENEIRIIKELNQAINFPQSIQ